MLHVVLDTNAVGIHRPLRDNPHSALLDACEAGQLRLVVPELVLREIVNKWAESVGKGSSELQRVASDLAMMGAIPEEGVPAALDVDRLASELRQAVTDRLDEVGAEMPPLPDVDHADVVQRALDRRQPFDKKGHDGYRDVLLWENVISLAEAGHDVVLVSNDARAFAAAADDRQLSEALEVEVVRRTARAGCVRLLATPREAVKRLLESSDQAIDAVRTLIEEDDRFGEDFFYRIEAACSAISLDKTEVADLASAAAVLTGGEVIDVEDIADIDFAFGRETSNGDVLVDIDAEVMAEVRVTFPVAEYSLVAATEDFRNFSEDMEEGTATATTHAILTASLDATVDVEQHATRRVRLTEILDVGRA